nr:RNA-dependent RNA polymerase [Totiviridae sp.]
MYIPRLSLTGAKLDEARLKPIMKTRPKKKRMFDLQLCMFLERAKLLDVPTEVTQAEVATALRRSRRFFGGINSSWGSFRNPLSLYQKLTKKYIPKFWEKLAEYHPANDDHAAAILKAISDECAAALERTKDMRFALLVGIGTCGAARKATHEQILAGVRDWVTGPTSLAADAVRQRWAKRWVHSMVVDWVKTHVRKGEHTFKSFEEFMDDPTLWATSGSAPTVQGPDGKVRSKWAWATEIINEYGSIHGYYGKKNNRAGMLNTVATVALKEESAKVRLVIATPIFSHLRQSYLLERLGNPRTLNATFTDPDITLRLLSGWTSLVGLDASKFDHNVPLWLIEQFWSSLAYATRTTALRDLEMIARDELHYLKRTVVRYGKDKIPYEKGFLSGWRMTSFLGSMVSQMISDYIFDTTPTPFSSIVQGDDIIMYSTGKLDRDAIIRAAQKFGVIINQSKTTTGANGEFLKYFYTPERVIGLPARGLRAIYYANPWLPTVEVRSPKSVVDSWWVLLSRLIPFTGTQDWSWWVSEITKDVRGWAGGGVGWERYVTTPQCVGGGGCLELSDYARAFRVTRVVETQSKDLKLVGAQVLTNLLGVYTPAVLAPKQVKTESKPVVGPSLNYTVCTRPAPLWEGKINKWKSFMSWLGVGGEQLKGLVRPIKDVPWPRYANEWKVSRKIRWLMATDQISSSPSLTTNRFALTSVLKSWQENWIARQWTRSRPPSKVASMSFALGLDNLVRNSLAVYFTL